MHFFNGTPSGRILGRFSVDVETARVAFSVFGFPLLTDNCSLQLDDNVPQFLSYSSTVPVQVLAAAILIGIYLPYFLIALVGASIFFIIGSVHLLAFLLRVALFHSFVLFADLLPPLDDADARFEDNCILSSPHSHFLHCPRYTLCLVLLTPSPFLFISPFRNLIKCI